MLNVIMTAVQLWLLCVMGIYFYTMLKSQKSTKSSIHRDANGELEKLRRMQKTSLTEPLSEKTRPSSLEEIVGQEDGLKALKAALCGKNPQHVIIYGPPGVGKTAAARTVLKEAVANSVSPFGSHAQFVEMDATTMRFDERGIADPLMGSVHDPIYQGAGAYGPAGIPQPKAGAVTKAHGGILFIDEIGELHPVQMNKLLKVLEDRKVYFESAYYAKNNREIPMYIHEIFQKGMPADFRLVAATTSSPEEIPPALRSRCTEIYFRPLTKKEIMKISENAAIKGGFSISREAVSRLSEYADNGRDAVNIVQTAGSCASLENRTRITLEDVEWVAESTRCTPRAEIKVSKDELIGRVNGLAVYGANMGTVMTIEAEANPCEPGKGAIKITGVVESETIERRGQSLKRESTVKASIENAITVLAEKLHTNTKDYNIHLNFPGGMPVDGPSAGTAILVSLFSAIHHIPVRNDIAFTGEISIFGNVMPVGGVAEKVAAAKEAGAQRVYIPQDNDRSFLHAQGIAVIPVKNIDEIMAEVFKDSLDTAENNHYAVAGEQVLTAESVSGNNVLS